MMASSPSFDLIGSSQHIHVDGFKHSVKISICLAISKKSSLKLVPINKTQLQQRSITL
jgi:hypothetical protein